MKKLFNMILTLNLLIAVFGYFSTAFAYTAYTSKTEFVAALDSYYIEDFNELEGTPLQLNMGPENGFAYTITTPISNKGLYIDGGILSTESTNTKLTISFSGDAVTAVGGTIWAFDEDVIDAPANVIIRLNLAGGGVENHYLENAFTDDFIGITSSSSFTSVEIIPNQQENNTWWAYRYINLDNLYVGSASAVPVPGTIGLLAAGFLGLAGIQRKKQQS